MLGASLYTTPKHFDSFALTVWDENTGKVKKNHPNSVRLNNLILKKLSEATDSALELETSKTSNEITAPRAGTISLTAKEGDIVSVDESIATIS